MDIGFLVFCLFLTYDFAHGGKLSKGYVRLYGRTGRNNGQ